MGDEMLNNSSNDAKDVNQLRSIISNKLKSNNIYDFNENRKTDKQSAPQVKESYQGFLLSPEQIDWIEKEKQTLVRIIQSGGTKGIYSNSARLEAIMLMIDIHNVEMNKRNGKT